MLLLLCLPFFKVESATRDDAKCFDLPPKSAFSRENWLPAGPLQMSAPSGKYQGCILTRKYQSTWKRRKISHFQSSGAVECFARGKSKDLGNFCRKPEGSSPAATIFASLAKLEVYFSRMTLRVEKRTDFGRLARRNATIFGTRLAPSFGSTFAEFRRDRTHRDVTARFRAKPCAERAPANSSPELKESPENCRESHRNGVHSGRFSAI
jgi:hypothetical protein